MHKSPLRSPATRSLQEGGLCSHSSWLIQGVGGGGRTLSSKNVRLCILSSLANSLSLFWPPQAAGVSLVAPITRFKTPTPTSVHSHTQIQTVKKIFRSQAGCMDKRKKNSSNYIQQGIKTSQNRKSHCTNR